MRPVEELKSTDNPSVEKKLRRRVVAKKTGACDRCPPHDNENRKRRPRPDKYKNKR